MAGSGKAEGGGDGAREELHHDGRSFGSRAAVQSKPIHHRWFSYTVNKKRRGGEGLGASSANTDAGRILAEASKGEGDAGGGRGTPDTNAYNR